MTVSEKDRDIIARTLWGAASGESLAGHIAVAWTICNGGATVRPGVRSPRRS